jgi:FAD-linked oxidoreductase
VPADADQVREVVAGASARRTRVKAVGSGHSFSGIAVADGVQLDLSRLAGLVAVDAERKRVTFGAGTPLHAIPALLAPHGLAMANLGDIDRQTLAGATATGTHGTGARFGGLSTQIVGLTLVTGTGEVRTITDAEPQLLAAAALSLGALGVVVDITLQCVPAFALHAVERPERIDEVVASFADNVARHDHYEFYWFPHTDLATTKTNTRLPADTPPEGPGRLRRLLDDELISNYLFGLLCGVGAVVPAAVAPIMRTAGVLLSARELTAASHAVFTSARRVRFREMEYAIGLAAVPDALAEVRALISRKGYRVSFPIEVRAAAADDLMLSTACGRDTGYLAVHRYHRDRPDDYFADVEAIMVAHGGRPHWGKMHTRDADYLRGVYPRFDEFLAVREKFDPDRIFANRCLDTVLGR